MGKVIVMVHSHMSEVVLCGFLNRIPGTEVINLAYPATLFSDLEADYFIVEANYGHPASHHVNSDLLNSIITAYPEAKIIAYSGTIEALAETLRLYKQPNVAVMSKNNKLEEDITSIYTILSTQDPETYPLPSAQCEQNLNQNILKSNSHSNSNQFLVYPGIVIAPRVYSTAKLKEELLQEKVRLRSSTISETSPPTLRNTDTRPRARTHESVTPLFDLTVAKQDEQNIANSTVKPNEERINGSGSKMVLS